MSLIQDARRLLGHLRPELGRYLFGIFSLFMVNLSDVLAPLFLAVAVDIVGAEFAGTAIKTPTLLALLGLDASTLAFSTTVVWFLALSICANVFRFPMMMYIGVPSHRVGQSFRNALVDKLLRLPRAYYDRASSGDLMSRATSDIGAVRMFYGPGIMIGLDTVILVTLVLAVMFMMSWELTLVTMIPLPLIAIITNKLSHMEFKRFAAVQDDLASLTEQARESYAGANIIQGYAREGWERERFRVSSARHLDKNLALARVNAFFEPTLDLMIGLSTAFVLVWGCIQVIDGAVSLGTFVAFLFLVRHLSGPMIGFGWAVSLFQRGRASYGRLEELLHEPVTIHDAPEAVEIEGPGAIEVRDLTFAYTHADRAEDHPRAGEPVLRNVSLNLPAGQRLGVIGPVGSGKSTLASLLIRLYDPPPGAVYIDGVDVRDTRLDALRRQIVLAPQETFLFSDTVERNVDLTRPDPEADHVARLVNLACLSDEVEALPKQYRTLLGPRGVNLSGGQRQRLAIARAIGADPRVLVLDDCLSAVDSRTEEAILDNLDAIFAGRTGVIISHRVAAVSRCDQIIVLQDGTVTERGTHEELLARGGYYADIAREQTRGEAER